MKKKIVALCLCIALAVVAIGGATLAYFTDTKDVTNTFTVGNVNITLTEDKWDATKAKLIPGTTIEKNPTVAVVKGSEECYVRILMTISKSNEWDAIFDVDSNLKIEDFFKGYVPANWTYIKNTENADNTRTYEFRYKEAVNALNATDNVALPALFTAVNVPSTLTGTQIATLNGFNIVIVAQAIQTASFNGNVDAAWTAYDNQN